MKIWVDPYRCAGHGACCDEAPDLFEWDDDVNQAYAGVDVVPAGCEAQARSAAKACPERAVLVED